MRAGASARFTLLAVLEDLAPTSIQFEFALTLMDTRGIMEEAYSQACQRIADIAAAEFSSIPLEHHVLRAKGAVGSEIVAYAKSNEVSRIVIATRGRSGLSRFFLGSVTERVVRESVCPVLVVPTEVIV